MNPIMIAMGNPLLMIFLKIESSIGSVLKNTNLQLMTKLNWTEENGLQPLLEDPVMDAPKISAGWGNFHIPNAELSVFEEAVQMVPGLTIMNKVKLNGTFTNVVLWFDSPSSIYWLATNKILIDHFNPKTEI